MSHEKFNAFLEAKFQSPVNSTGQRKALKPRSRKDADYVGKESNALTFNVEQAKEQLEEMRSEISPNGIRAAMYIFNKNMRRAI